MYTQCKLANDVLSKMITFFPEDRYTIKDLLCLPCFDEPKQPEAFSDIDDFGMGSMQIMQENESKTPLFSVKPS